jgi:hypothetical protein
MAVMVWRWSEHELAFARLRERLRKRQRELFEAAETLGGKSVVPAETALGVASVVQQAMGSMTVYDKLLNPFPNYAKLLNPFPDYAKSLRLFTDHSALVPKLPDYSALAPRLPDYSRVALGFPDRSLMNATRLARSLYADPSPMVLSRVGGGVNNPLWSKSVQAVLGLGEPAWLQTVKGMTTDVALHRGIVAQVNVGLAGPLGVSSLLRMPALPFVDIGKTLRDFIDPLREARELFEEVGRFMSRWEQQALWFLFAHLGLRAWRRLANLGRAEVEEVVLHALEVVVTDGEVVPALRAAVGKARYLSPFQRTLLDNMLEQAAEGAYIKASGSMYPGLEGAFTEIGCARTVITPERRWTHPPHKPVSFDAMVKRLKLQHEGFELFVVTAVFGKAGDAYRHGYGDATTGVRRQVLFGIDALAGWLQEFTSVEALDALGARLERALPTAIEHVRRRLLDAGD